MEDQVLQPYEGSISNLCIVNPVSGPALKGASNSGINWHCPRCQEIVAEAIYPNQILNLLFRCHACGKLGSSPVRMPGQPIAGRPAILQRGEFYLKDLDITDKANPIIGYQAWESYLNETAAPPTPFLADMGDQIELGADLLRELASRAVELLGNDYSHLKATSIQSAISRTPKRSQPRLIELISYAEQAADLLENRQSSEIVNLDSERITELYGTISVFDRWRNHPAWPQLVKSLATETEGPHSLMLLTTAGYLDASGNGVGITFKKSTVRNPDLWMEPDLKQKVSIEVKTPQVFRNAWPSQLSVPDAKTAITRQLDKAASTKRSQFGTNSGILAIGSFHLPPDGLNQLVSITRGILDRQAQEKRKPNLVGVLLCEFGFSFVRTVHGNLASTGLVPGLKTKFVPHPGYRGTVQITEGLPRTSDVI